MSDIRFNQWLHQSGTGGITQVDGGHVGIGTTNPDVAVHTANNKKVNVGIVTANSVYAGNFYGDGSNLTSLPSQVTIANNADNRVITGGSGINLNAETNLLFDGGTLALNGRYQRGSATVQDGDAIAGGININGTDMDASVIMSVFGNDNDFTRISGSKSRNASIGGHTIVQNNDVLLSLKGFGSDGTNFEEAAQIEMQVDGTPNNNVMPGRIVFKTTTTDGVAERLRITSDGDFGTGGVTPTTQSGRVFHLHAGNAQQRFHMTNSTTGTSATDGFEILIDQQTNTNCRIRNFEAGFMAFDTGGANNEVMRITSSGQLLLGDTSAVDSNTATQFTKNNSGNNARFIFRNTANNGSSRVRLECMTLNRAANADTFSGIEKYQSGGMHIFNGESTNQYSGISLICGGHNVFRLKNGNHSGHDCAHIQAIWGTSNGLHMEQGGPQSGTHKAIRFTTSHYGGERGYIGVTLGGTSYNSSSDYRQKQDVTDLYGAINRVKSLKPRRFKWKDDPTYTVDGFLAHEAQAVVPESVVGEKDAIDKNGDPEYQVIDQSKLVPLLTAALQEAITEIETLKTKVAALEGN